MALELERHSGLELPVLSILIGLSGVAILLVAAYMWGSGRRFRDDKGQGSRTPDKFDTTLGEFRDMREALRSLQHQRASSRRDPQGRR